MTRQLGARQGGLSRPKKVGQGLGLVESKLSNGSFETSNNMARQLGRLKLPILGPALAPPSLAC